MRAFNGRPDLITYPFPSSQSKYEVQVYYLYAEPEVCSAIRQRLAKQQRITVQKCGQDEYQWNYATEELEDKYPQP